MDKKAKFLLLSCCAPCSCAVIARLKKEGGNFSVLFYNPNIMPFEEYEKRKEENKRLCRDINVDFVDLDYEHALWREYIKGLEHEPERGQRCIKCFTFRLNKAAAYAKENGFEYFTSVLGVSKYKNLDDVNLCAREAAALHNIPYDETNWRKNGLEEERRALIKEFNLYSQKYCGCKF